MSDDLATRLNEALSGRYAIARQLGEGGMATVYLAHDVRHERNVALKVLKPDLAAVVGAERFLAEIKTTANLQHPHILPLFDSGQADGFLFYVMPFVEGESLQQRLQREKQLPVEDALHIARSVASALARAHEQGVIHRDIKPANILLSRGDPLVADFGIALAVSAAGASRLTETGLSIGTPFYMSPEQATGDRELSPSSDVYALACVLFEMLVGEPPYTGSTAQAILGRIITERPPRVTEHRDTIPKHVEDVILRSLEKLPADRFPSAKDFAAALDDPSYRYGQAAGPGGAAAGRGRRWSGLVPWALAAGLALASIPRWLAPGAELPSEHLGIPLPDSAEVALRPLAPLGVARHALAISPDGRTIVYSGYDGEVTRLYARSLDSFDLTALPGTEGASDPFYSPDGEFLAFFQGTQLKRLSVRGGEPQVVTGAANAYGGYWGDDGEIVFVVSEGLRLERVAASGGEPSRVGDPGTGAWWFSHPKPLPGGEALLASARFPRHVVALPLPDGNPRIITEGEQARFVEPDILVFARGSTILAARFDPDALELLSEPIPIVSGVRSEHNVAQFEISSDGTLYFVPGRNADRGVLVWAGFDAQVDTLPFEPAEYQRTFVSPDGTRLATMIAEGSIGLYILDLETGRRVLLDEAPELSAPLWSPDGQSVAYGVSPDAGRDPRELVLHSVTGAQPRRVAQFEAAVWASSWSPDGDYLLVEVQAAGGQTDIHMVPTDTLGEPVTWLATEHSEWGGAVSPDGQWIAYTSDESGQYQVYVQPFEQTGQRVTISAHDNSEEPLWSSDGRTIYYRSSNQWWAVDVSYEPSFTPGSPRLVVEGAYLNVGERSYDLHPDGDRFLLIDTPREETADRILLIRNWVAGLGEQLGGG